MLTKLRRILAVFLIVTSLIFLFAFVFTSYKLLFTPNDNPLPWVVSAIATIVTGGLGGILHAAWGD